MRMGVVTACAFVAGAVPDSHGVARARWRSAGTTVVGGHITAGVLENRLRMAHGSVPMTLKLRLLSIELFLSLHIFPKHF